MVDPDETRTARLSYRQGADSSVGEQVDADGDADSLPDGGCNHGHCGNDLRTDIRGLQEWNIAVVLDDHAVHAAFLIDLGVGNRASDDRRHILLAIARGARQRRQMNIADQRFRDPEEAIER